MRQYGGDFRHASASHPTNVGERIVTFIKARHPNKTPDHVAAETGVPATTIAKWIERESVPNGLAIIKLIIAYGPHFLCTVIREPPAWLCAAAHAEELAAIDAEFVALQKRREALR